MERLFKKLLFAVLGLGMAGGAAADPLAIQINDPNAQLSGYPPPYALIVYDAVDADTATFTITAYNPYVLFDGSSLALNFNGAVSIVGGLAGITSNSVCANPFTLGSGNVSDFGNFNFTIDTFDGPNCGWTSMSFTVDLVSGTWANTGDVLTLNDKDQLAATHVAAGCTGSPPNRDCAVTGFAGGEEAVPPNEIPEPHTLALLGLALLGLCLGSRRRQ